MKMLLPVVTIKNSICNISKLSSKNISSDTSMHTKKGQHQHYFTCISLKYWHVVFFIKLKPFFFTLAIKVPFCTSCNISLLYSNSLLKIAPYTENDNKMNSFKSQKTCWTAKSCEKVERLWLVVVESSLAAVTLSNHFMSVFISL